VQVLALGISRLGLQWAAESDIMVLVRAGDTAHHIHLLGVRVMKTVTELMRELEVKGQTSKNAKQVIELLLEGSREDNERDVKRVEEMYRWIDRSMIEMLKEMVEEHAGEATHGGDGFYETDTKEDRMRDFIGYFWFSKYKDQHEAIMKEWEEKKQLKTGKMATCRVNTDIMLDLG